MSSEWNSFDAKSRLSNLFAEGSETDLEQGYREAASVLSSFSPASLNPIGGAGNAEEALYSVLDEAEPAHDSSAETRWTLLPDARRRVLRKLVSEDRVKDALAANPQRPFEPVQKALESYLLGSIKPLEYQHPSELAATLQVADWLSGIVPGVPKIEEVQQRLEYESLLEPFRHLASEFAGREAQMDELSDYVGIFGSSSLSESAQRAFERIFSIKTRPPLFIRAPGGLGKSTLVAQFILTHGAAQYIGRFPFAYLDFDRPGLLAEEPITLLLEAIRQFAIQYPNQSAAARTLRQQWNERLRNGRESVVNKGSTFRIQDRDWFYNSFAEYVDSIKTIGRVVLLVLDTFEEVQFRSRAFVSNVFELLEEIQHRVPELRTVLAGRAPLKLRGYSVREMQLPPFDVSSGQAFLRKQGIDNDLVAMRIVEQVGGSPLTLKLAARLVRMADEDVGPGKIRTLDIGVFDRILGESTNAQLYYRILDHIHDPVVRKLAHPGLVLRRITAALIRRVLAEPCGVEVKDAAAAEDLFRRLSKEVALVDSIDPNVLEHRSDVREIMLPLIKKNDERQARRINRAAIEYYAARRELADRGEELYHRLLFGDFDRAEVERRILPEALLFVQRSIADLPDRSKAFVGARTNTECADAVWKRADLEDWELHAVQTAAEFLDTQNPAGALEILGERSARSAGSPLFALEIDTLLAMNRLMDADERSKSFLGRAGKLDNPDLLFDALLRRERVNAVLTSPLPLSEFEPFVESLLKREHDNPRWSEFLSLLETIYNDPDSRRRIQDWRASLGSGSTRPPQSPSPRSERRRRDGRLAD